MWGGEKKKFQNNTQHGLRNGERNQLEFTTLVSPGIGKNEKGAPISSPSIHIGALVGVGSLWP
jgi:hypothetical protein